MDRIRTRFYATWDLNFFKLLSHQVEHTHPNYIHGTNTTPNA
ncbi:hypothetical protein HHE06_10970 [Helicobacter heilmannii]|nr:hypothetical protein HHE014_01000 [Helicobacter heilmannii]CRF51233.1 hypothetical protein HHE06_10970 [Helicobacter heilmannii]